MIGLGMPVNQGAGSRRRSVIFLVMFGIFRWWTSAKWTSSGSDLGYDLQLSLEDAAKAQR